MRPYKYTDQEELFCREYLIDLNIHRAWEVAYQQQAQSDKIPDRTKKRKAFLLFEKLKIQQRIHELQEERSRRLQFTADDVIKKIIEVVDRCMQAIPVFGPDGEPTGEWQFREAGALRGLELLGKHFNIFTERLEITNPVLEILRRKLEGASPEDLRNFLTNYKKSLNGSPQRIEHRGN